MPELTIVEVLGSLAGIVIVVLLFLKHISEQRKLEMKSNLTHLESIKQIATDFREDSKLRKDEMMKNLDRNTDVISENTKQAGETSVVLGQTADVLRRLNERKT